MDRHLDRIRFVTSHYAELRAGVTRAALAPVLSGVSLAGRSSLSLAFVGASSLVILSALVDMWLNARFGRVVVGSRRQRGVTLVCVLTVLFAIRMEARDWRRASVRPVPRCSRVRPVAHRPALAVWRP